MGWLYMQGVQGYDTPRAYLDNQFTYARDTHRATVLASALVGMRTYYAAVERVETNGDRIVFAVVCLVDYNPRAADGYSFGYKDMDETVGPCEAACPAAILDLLTPTTYEHAIDWRARCRAALARRKAVSARPTPKAGQTILFDPPLSLSDGRDVSRFDVVADPRDARRTLFRDPETRRIVRIPHVKTRPYRLIHAAVRPVETDRPVARDSSTLDHGRRP